MHVDSTASLKIVKPTVTYHLTIGGSKLVHADLMLHGAASLEFVLKAATTDHSKGQGFPALTIPLETDIPLVVAGIPLKVSVTQAFVLKTGLIGSASLETKGSYRLDGDLGFSLDGTTPHLSIPTFTTVASLAKDMKINDVSSPTLSFGYSVRLTLGVGTIGFTAGPYLQITTGIGLAGAGNVTEFALRPCLNAAVTVDADYGVGYRISSSVLPFVNDFLKLVNVKPIPATGGPSFGPSALWHPGPYQFCLPRTTS